MDYETFLIGLGLVRVASRDYNLFATIILGLCISIQNVELSFCSKAADGDYGG